MAKLQNQTPPPASTAPRYPDIVGLDEEEEEDRLSPDTARQFLLLWTRGDYYVAPGGQVLPRLIYQVLENGVAGVRQRKDLRFDTSGLVDDSKQAKKRVLPVSLGYCLAVEGMPNCWRPAWSEVREGVLRTEPGAYERWVETLYATGEIPRPTPDQCRSLAEKYDNLVAMDPSRSGHSREIVKYAAMRDAALRQAEAVPA